MSDLNIRNVNPELHAKAKAKASLEIRTLRDVVIGLLESYVGTPAGSSDLNGAHCPVNGPVIKASKKKGKNNENRKS